MAGDGQADEDRAQDKCSTSHSYYGNLHDDDDEDDDVGEDKTAAGMEWNAFPQVLPLVLDSLERVHDA